MTTTIPVYAPFVGADATTPVTDEVQVSLSVNAAALGDTVGDALSSIAAALLTLVATNGIVADFSTAGQVTLQIDPTASLAIQRLAGIGANKPTFALGTGAGGGTPVGTVTGGSFAFRFDLTAGSAPVANSTIAQFTFKPGAYAVAPLVLMVPANALASVAQSTAANAITVPVGNITTTGFILHSGSTNGITASAAFSWYFLVFGG